MSENQVQSVFEQICDLASAARAERLRALCGGDAALRAEVESLLAFHDQDDTFLRPPPPPPSALWAGGLVDQAGARPRAEEAGPAEAGGAEPRVCDPHASDAPVSDSRVPHASDLHAGDPLLGREIGGCRIERVIAAGGMGTVYLAEQQRPRRQVALKVMRPGLLAGSGLRRFEFEAEFLARLRHPNIAEVYEAGAADVALPAPLKLPYFVMEHVPDARPITHYASERRLARRQRLELFTHVCEAVQHAHQRGVIHRDLKPANILVGGDGRVKVIDFGVARATGADLVLTTMQTATGELIGTLQYMSPEQCAADASELDTRTDVYALGVTLYELLCGRLPYDVSRNSLAAAARIICEQPPMPPNRVGPVSNRPTGAEPVGPVSNRPLGQSSLAPDSPRSAEPDSSQSIARSVSDHPSRPADSSTLRPPDLATRRPAGREASAPIRGDLERLLLKALAKKPAERYQSPADLLRDIRHYLAGEPIEARPPTLWARALRWAMRHPIAMTVGTCLAIAAMMFATTYASIWWFNRLPHSLALFDEQGAPVVDVCVEARLLSRSGVVLQNWSATAGAHIKSARLVDRPPEFAGGRIVLLAFGPHEDSELRGSLCAFNTAHPNSLLWQRRLGDDERLPMLVERHIPASNFAPEILACEDIFPDGAAPGSEIVVTFRGAPASLSVIRIYNTKGDVLYQIWQDGGMSQCYWMKDAGLLVFLGYNGVVPWEARGYPSAERDSGQPLVICALRPRLEFVVDDCLHETPRSGPDADPLHPEWLKCLWPPHYRDLVRPPHSGQPGVSLSRLSMGDPGRAVAVSLSVDSERGIGISWSLNELGELVPGGRVVSANPDGAPPEVRAVLPLFELKPLPPIIGYEDDPPCLTPREYWNNAP